MIFVVWFIFMIQIVFTNIVLLNFVIAVVSQSYDKNMAEYETLEAYQTKADLNVEWYSLKRGFLRLWNLDTLDFELMLICRPRDPVTQIEDD